MQKETLLTSADVNQAAALQPLSIKHHKLNI